MKIEQLRIRNFRAIGDGQDGEGIVIRFAENNLIFLSGENNTGKSSVLVAYDSFVSAEFKPTESDFHGKDLGTPIEIEAWIRAESDVDRNHQDFRKWWRDDLAKIRKTWRKKDVEGEKESFDPVTEAWVAGGAGGFDTLLQNACPTVVWIKGMGSPGDVILTRLMASTNGVSSSLTCPSFQLDGRDSEVRASIFRWALVTVPREVQTN